MEQYANFYVDTSGLQENTPLLEFIRNYIGDSSGVFSISSPVKISMISLVSSLSLNYIALKFVGVSSKQLKIFLESPRQSSVIFHIFGNFSESGRKSSEDRLKRRYYSMSI